MEYSIRGNREYQEELKDRVCEPKTVLGNVYSFSCVGPSRYVTLRSPAGFNNDSVSDNCAPDGSSCCVALAVAVADD